VPGDYSTVEPIPKMISFLREIHSKGHVVIIYTARRMKTHSGNVGALLKDIGPLTFKTLEDFDIPYDELIFGKPIADVYIDDKALNPYINDIDSLGYYYSSDKDVPLNFLSTNKHNSIEVNDNNIVKRGPKTIIKGEIEYYKNINSNSLLLEYFPKYITSSFNNDVGELIIEKINGIPAYTLYKSDLLTSEHIDIFLNFLNVLHNISDDSPTVSIEDINNNYIKKLEERFLKEDDYPFEDSKIIQGRCLSCLKSYLSDNNIEIVKYIHGDFWFSNIIMDFKGNMKTFDMKGRINKIYTCQGHKLYDYAKLYQSIIGYDCVLNNFSIPKNSHEIKEHFEKKITEDHISINHLRTITFSLIIGYFNFIESLEAKLRVWAWMKSEFLQTWSF
jgi:hypothetical protein